MPNLASRRSCHASAVGTSYAGGRRPFDSFNRSLCFRPNIRVHALPNVLGSVGRTPCCLQNAMYDSLRCSFATLVPRLSDPMLPCDPAGLRMTSTSIHHCDHCEILSPLILCWRRRQSPRGCCCPLSNGFIAYPFFVFVVLWLDFQRLVELNHLAPTGGQIDPNDELIARCRRAF